VSTATLSLIRNVFPRTTRAQMYATMNRRLGNFRCSTSDFLKAKKINNNAIPIGASANVSNGNAEK